jgi:hypothetical protein
MTQEDKELLLKDLCARLPYGVIIQEYNEEYGYSDNALNTIGIGYFSIHEASIEGTWINRIENVKPYLRPLSSMTKDENNERKQLGILCSVNNNRERIFDGFENKSVDTQLKSLDWLNAHHFDYRGLIPKGLALEAPEGMYKI